MTSSHFGSHKVLTMGIVVPMNNSDGENLHVKGAARYAINTFLPSFSFLINFCSFSFPVWLWMFQTAVLNFKSLHSKNKHIPLRWMEDHYLIQLFLESQTSQIPFATPSAYLLRCSFCSRYKNLYLWQVIHYDQIISIFAIENVYGDNFPALSGIVVRINVSGVFS